MRIKLLHFSFLFLFFSFSATGQSTFEHLEARGFFKKHPELREQFLNSEKIAPQERSVRPRNAETYGTPPNFAWLKEFGGSSLNTANALAEAPDGSIYVTGSFSGEMIWGTTTLSSVFIDMFVAKVSATGEVLWLKQYAPSGKGEWLGGYSITVSDAGKVYVGVGLTGGTDAFGTSFLSDTKEGCILTEIDSATGNPIWATQISAPIDFFGDIARILETDSDGNIYMILQDEYDNTPSFSIVHKFDPSGNVLATLDNGAIYKDIIISGTDLYLAGYIEDGTHFDNTFVDLIGWSENSFLAKFDTDFVFSQISKLDPDENISSDGNYPFDITQDTDGNIYMVGYFDESIVIGGETSEVRYGVYIVKAGADLEFEKVTAFEINQSDFWFRSYGLKLAHSGDQLYLRGNTQGGNILLPNGEQPVNDGGDGFSLVYNSANEVQYFTRTSNQTNGLITAADGDFLSAGTINIEANLIRTDSPSATADWDLKSDGDSGATALSYNSKMGSFSNGDLALNVNFTGKLALGDDLFYSEGPGTALVRVNNIGDLVSSYQFKGAYNMVLSSHFAIDGNDNSYISGSFGGMLENDLGTFSSTDGNLFLCKINRFGNVVWFKQMNGIYFSELKLHFGKLYFAGVFDEDTDAFGNSFTSAGDFDGFLGSINPADGSANWVKQFGGAFGEYLPLFAIDKNDNLFLNVETSSEQFIFGSETIEMPDLEGDVLLMQLDIDGNLGWTKQYGGTADNAPFGSEDYSCSIHDLELDQFGNILVNGRFGLFNTIGDIRPQIPPGSEDAFGYYYNTFVAKFNPSGEEQWVFPVWSARWGTPGYSFVIDDSGDVLFTGETNDTMFFDNVVNFSNEDTQDAAYVAKISADGVLDWVTTICTNSFLRIFGLNRVNDSDIVMMGGFLGDITTANGQNLSSISYKGFLGYLSDVTNTKAVPSLAGIEIEISPVPSPNIVTVKLNLSETREVAFEIYDLSGRLMKKTNSATLNSGVHLQEFDMNAFNSGVYFLKISTPNGALVKKIEKI